MEKINRRIETMTEHGAKTLMFHIKRYWAERGKHPKVWVDFTEIPGGDNATRSIVTVRSDMVGGQPR